MFTNLPFFEQKNWHLFFSLFFPKEKNRQRDMDAQVSIKKTGYKIDGLFPHPHPPPYRYPSSTPTSPTHRETMPPQECSSPIAHIKLACPPLGHTHTPVQEVRAGMGGAGRHLSWRTSMTDTTYRFIIIITWSASLHEYVPAATARSIHCIQWWW